MHKHKPAFFRSEKMSLCQMLLHKESAFDCLVELGILGVVEFIPEPESDHATDMKFMQEVMRCNDMQRTIQMLETEMGYLGFKPIFYPDVDTEEIPEAKDVKEIERLLQEVQDELNDVHGNYDGLRNRNEYLLEKLHVLTRANMIFTGERNTDTIMAWSDSVVMGLLHDASRTLTKEQSQMKLGFFVGSIQAERFHNFELMLWRVCHRNFFLKYAEIPELLNFSQQRETGIRKYAFVVFFVGDMFRDKIMKICQGFRCTLFECPESYEQRQALIMDTTNELANMKVILRRSEELRRRTLLIAAADLYIWKVKVKKILKVYAQLNKLHTVRELNNEKYLQADCWIPTRDVQNVRQALTRGAQRASKGEVGMMFPPILLVQKNHTKDPPTFYRLNKFTRGFQNLIDSYGIGTYRELNPAPYTIITFPFLFAVMFGDMGHGLILTIFATILIMKEEKILEKQRVSFKSNEVGDILFSGRYIILLMGIFSIYTGSIYNIIFSKPINLLGSHWRVNYNVSTVHEARALQLNPESVDYQGTPYVFGMDPVWGAAGEYAITTLNSMKMKLAIILGVTQMIFGLILSARNFTNQRSWIDLFFVFFPQLIFLSCLFVYLVALIILKWCLYGGHNKEPFNTACAPSVLITFINMVMFKTSSELPPACSMFMYPHQLYVQYGLVLAAALCVPILLVGKPLYYMKEKRRIKRLRDEEKKMRLKHNTATNLRRSLLYNIESKGRPSRLSKKPLPAETVDIGELWIHQGIHCIESVLGSVSHTASYLRLWALSLAHDQLATVLWQMEFAKSLKIDYGYFSPLCIFLAFGLWAIFTVSILVVMEGLSAFLHTLRLHWVEFQSKFYAGSGELFMPFYFERSTIKG